MTQTIYFFSSAAAALILSPLLPGIINKVKAFFAGRKGPRVLQTYYDIFKLLKKESIKSSTSGGLVRLGPVLNLAALIMALLLLPNAMAVSPFSFSGDIILFLYLLGFGRMMTVLGALDTGSAFEGMGASREMQFSALAEIAFLAVAAFLAILTRSFTLSEMLQCNAGDYTSWTTPAILFTAFALLIVLLAENCRVPFDDPETHLELTMIHEAMVLDNGGPDLAVIHYGAALKLWLLSVFFVTVLLPSELCGYCGLLIQPAAVIMTSVLVGVIESTMARYRFLKVPQMLLTAFALVIVAIAMLFIFSDAQ